MRRSCLFSGHHNRLFSNRIKAGHNFKHNMSAFITQTSLEDTVCLLGKRNVNLSLDNLELNRRLRKAQASLLQVRKERNSLKKMVRELNKVPLFANCDVSFDEFANIVENPNKP